MHEQALRLDELEKAFREIVEGKDATTLSLKILADVYIAAGKQQEAATTWRRLAAQTGADDSVLLLSLAERFRTKKMHAETAKVCQHLIATAKDQYTLRRAQDILASTRQPPDQKDELLAFYKKTLSANFGLNDWWKAARWLTTFYEERGELHTFIDEVSELIEKNPGDSALYSCLVIAQKQNNDYAGAIDTLKEQLEIRTPGVKFSFELARTYEEAGLNQQAEEAYTWLTQQKQPSSYAYGPLVALLYRTGNSEQANEAIEQTKRNLPKDPNSLRIIADLYESVDNRESAEALYLEAIEGAPDIVFGLHGSNILGQGSKLELRHLLAKRYRDWGDLPKAEEQYRIVIGKTKDDTYGRIAVKQLVEMLRETDDLGPTLERNELLLSTLKEQLINLQSATDRAKKTQSAFIEQSVYLVAVYQEDKQLAKVVSVYEAVVEALPEDSDAWIKLAESHDKAGLLEEAAETYEKLIKMLPDRRKNFLYKLKSLYMRARNTEDVLRVAGQLISEYGDADAYRAAAHMYEDLDMYEKALEHFQRALALDEDPRMRSDDLLSIAIVYRVLEDYERSRRMYEPTFPI